MNTFQSPRKFGKKQQLFQSRLENGPMDLLDCGARVRESRGNAPIGRFGANQRFAASPAGCGRVSVRVRAFTLIELLVVIAIIAILAAMLLPVLSSANERSRRAACVSNVHQFILAAHLYANDFQDCLPRGGTDNRNALDTHTPILSSVTQTNILQYARPLKVLDCPNLARSFEQDQSWRVQPEYGVAIGYHYLGGQLNTPWAPAGSITNTWTSPQKTVDDPALPLIADLNVYAYSYQRILAPHTSRGPIIRDEAYFELHPDAYQQTPRAIGGQGGNVGLLSGSVEWKSIARMKAYRSSQLWGADGSFGLW